MLICSINVVYCTDVYIVHVYTAGETSALSDDEASGSYLHPRLLPTRASKVCYDLHCMCATKIL